MDSNMMAKTVKTEEQIKVSDNASIKALEAVEETELLTSTWIKWIKI